MRMKTDLLTESIHESEHRTKGPVERSRFFHEGTVKAFVPSTLIIHTGTA